MGERAFSKIQYGKETISTHGTAVAATKILAGIVPALTPDRKPRRPQVNVGIRSDKIKSLFDTYLVRSTLSLEHGYFQALPMFFSCGLKGGVTASEVTPSQADYLWTFTPSETASNTPDSITLEMGDDVQAYEAEYVMFERLHVAGEIPQDGGDAPVLVEGDFFGRQWTGTTFTGALTVPTPEYMVSKLSQFYLDTTWAGAGGTEKTSLLRGFDIEILTGLHPKMLGSGDRFFTTHGQGLIDVMASFTFENNSDADAIWDNFRSQALQVVRFKISGSQIGTGTVHSLILDIGGTWDEVIPLSGEDKGNNLCTALLVGQYDVTGAKKLVATVTTNSSTI